MSQKRCLIARSEVLGLFGNFLTADHMYSSYKWEKFQQHVQTPLSEKHKILCWIVIAFSQSTQKFVDFEKKINFIA